MTVYVVTNEEAREAVAHIIGELPTPFTMEIKDQRKRSLEQNALYYHWVTELAQQRGDTPREEIRAEMKLRFGVPILRRDNEKFRETYDRILKPLGYEDKINAIMDFDLPVTSLMTVDQLTEFLNVVETYYIGKGFRLTHLGV